MRRTNTIGFDAKHATIGDATHSSYALFIIDAMAKACPRRSYFRMYVPEDDTNPDYERLELCHMALMCRHERLKGTLSDAAPILWQHGAIARLKKGEKIDKLLYGGYSSISLGL